jgi:hypothetical protein
MKSGPRIRALVPSRSRRYGVRSGLVIGQGAESARGREDAVNRGLRLGVLLEVARPVGHVTLFARNHGALRGRKVGIVVG